MAFPEAVLACGLCHEDDRSAVYSFEAVQKAKAQPDKLEFVVLKVSGAFSATAADRLGQWLKARTEVDPASVKVSATQKSIGFLLERAQGKDALVADLQKDFQGLKFHVLKYD